MSEWFAAVIGVMQGYILSPLLFGVLLDVVIALALEDNEVGANVSGIGIPNLRFADDICLAAESRKRPAEVSKQSLYATRNRFGRRVSGTKTEVQCIGREMRERRSCWGTVKNKKKNKNNVETDSGCSLLEKKYLRRL